MKNQNQITCRKDQLNGRRIFLLSFFILFFCVYMDAQDRIMLSNGTEVYAKIIQINDVEVMYKTPDNLDGPTRVVNRYEVLYIRYENGIKEMYGNDSKKSRVNLDTTDFLPDDVSKYGGPRFGFTYITPGKLTDKLSEMGKNPLITQFGWQFEARLFTINSGPQGIIEFIPLIGGMEQGVFLPSASLLVGLRGAGKNSFEFAVGPNLSLSGLGMVFAAGTNFKSGNINFPVNFAFVPSVSSLESHYDEVTQTYKNSKVGTGYRFSITIGFNSRKK